jgi:hypothetical protein
MTICAGFLLTAACQITGAIHVHDGGLVLGG